MSENIGFLLIFTVLFVPIQNRGVPKLSVGHAKIGDYPDMNMPTCGSLSPTDKPKVESRIIAGNITEVGEFPWHAAIYIERQTYRKYICGGALIHKYWVLTAKRCFVSQNMSPLEADNLIVGLGSVKKEEPYATYLVGSIFEHPLENLALLRLTKAVIPQQTEQGSDYRINFICLPLQMIINTYNEDAIVSAFGYINADNSPPNNILRKTTLLIDPFVDCDKRNLPPKYICGTESVHMTCFEDMGSPLVQFDGQRAVIIGIVDQTQSWDGRKCGLGVVVFFRISYFIDWLNDYIGRNITHRSTPPRFTIYKTTESTKTQVTSTITDPEPQKNVGSLATNLKINLLSVIISIIFSIIHYS